MKGGGGGDRSNMTLMKNDAYEKNKGWTSAIPILTPPKTIYSVIYLDFMVIWVLWFCFSVCLWMCSLL